MSKTHIKRNQINFEDSKSHIITAAMLVLFINFMGLTWLSSLEGSTNLMIGMVSYINPIAMASVFIFSRNAIEEDNASHAVVALSVLLCCIEMISVLGNDSGIKGVVMALFLPTSLVALMSLFNKNNVLIYLGIVGLILVSWVLTPVLLMLVLPKHFYSPQDYSYHGLAESRIGLSMWASMLILLLWVRSNVIKINRYFICVVWLILAMSIYFSQSRTAVVGLSLFATTLVCAEGEVWRVKALKIFGCIAICFLIISSWKLFGRQEPLEMLDSNRLEILNKYRDLDLDSMNYFKVLFGQGRQVSIAMSSGVATQAHNLLIQWFFNYGLLGAVALVLFLVGFLMWLKTAQAKGVFVVFMSFSMTQPLQGTANFFGAATLIWFSVIIAVDVMLDVLPGDVRKLRIL